MRGLSSLVSDAGSGLLAQGRTLSVAESCTGGLLGHLLTNLPGSSEWFLGGVIAYANSVKSRVLEVSGTILSQEGAVSERCVLAMGRGVRELTGSSCSVAISGIAGPGGGSATKPVGTVWIAWDISGEACSRRFQFSGDREEIKYLAVQSALEGLIGLLGRPDGKPG